MPYTGVPVPSLKRRADSKYNHVLTIAGTSANN